MTKLVKHISFSEYRLYASCAFRHALEKQLGYEQGSNEFLVFGSALHSSIEEIIKKKLNKILYEKTFARYLEEESNGAIVKSYFGRQFITQGTALLKALDFFERYKDWEVVGVEDQLYEPLYTDDEKEVNFKGIVDLILKKDDKYLIIDWKSAMKPWDIDKKQEDKSFFGQLALYKHFFASKHGIPLENISTRFVTLARDPVNIQQYEINISDEFMKFMVDDVMRVAKEIGTIDKGKLPKAKHSGKPEAKQTCAWCPFNKNKPCNDEVEQLAEPFIKVENE
jgi:hypothetical protein